MDYQEAVALAKSGKEEGFRFLYEATYQSKYYLAVQYMKNEEEARDVLQDAYIRAFSRLDSLQEAHAFPGWLGRIVANTAKNRLVKNKPVLFAQQCPGNDTEEFEASIEDEDISIHPELAYLQQERDTIVHELIDSLSAEQRMCILMYYMEGDSVRQIASALGCSENTVKSRLNYGRKNIKSKSEQLQEKGYCLYGVAPLPLFLYLLRAQASEMCASGIYAETGKAIADKIFSDPQICHFIDGASQTKYAAKASVNSAVKSAAKSGFFHTAAGKATAVLLGVCVAGGTVYGAARLIPSLAENRNETPPPAVQPTIQATTAEAATTSIATTALEPRALEAADYPALITGGLTKEEVEFVLAYGPDEIPEQGFSITDYTNFLNSFCLGSESNGIIKNYGVNEEWKAQYAVADINRLFDVFTDYRFEESDWDTEFIRIKDGILTYSPATLNYAVAADIVATEYTESKINIDYTYQYTGYEKPSYTASKRAVLEPTAEGMYRIARIETVDTQPEGTEAIPSIEADSGDPKSQTGGANEDAAIKKLYAGVLEDGNDENALYCLQDMNGDGIRELLMGKEVANGPFIYYDFHVYSCEKQGDTYALKPIHGSVTAMGLCITGDGNGLYSQQISRGTGAVEVFRITIQGGKLVSGSVERKMTLGSSEYETFNEANPAVEWIDISDQSAIATAE